MTTYNNEIIKLLKKCENEAKKLNHNFVGTEHFLLAILNSENEIKNKLNKNGITYMDCYNEIKKLIKVNNNKSNLYYTPVLKRLLLNTNDKSTIKSLFLSFIEEGEGLGITILNNLGIDLLSIYKELKNKIDINIGKNLNFQNNIPLIGREKELNEVIEILCRKNKNNPILIGEAGVGKTALIEELAQRINSKDVPDELLNKQIISINIASLISGTRYRGEFEEKLEKLIKEFENNKNLIMFIDEIHTIVGAGGAEGAIDASNILKPYLARDNIKCIGATTINEYKKYILNDKALNRRFQKVLINETNKEETINILKKIKKYYENYHKVSISDKQIELLYNLSSKYITDKKEPDRSIEMLDKICTRTKLNAKNKKDILLNLIKEKEKKLLENNYNEAIKIDNLIKKEKTIKNKVTNKIILNSIEMQKKELIGFKI